VECFNKRFSWEFLKWMFVAIITDLAFILVTVNIGLSKLLLL